MGNNSVNTACVKLVTSTLSTFVKEVIFSCTVQMIRVLTIVQVRDLHVHVLGYKGLPYFRLSCPNTRHPLKYLNQYSLFYTKLQRANYSIYRLPGKGDFSNDNFEKMFLLSHKM